MVLWAEWPERQIARLSHTGHDFREYPRRSRLFEGIAAIGSLRQNLGGGAEPIQVQVGWVSENFFSVLKIVPVLGRDFAPGEPPSSVLLSHSLWHAQFGGDPGVLSRVVELDQKPFTVVGVLPSPYDVSADGERFLLLESEDSASLRLHGVLNWLEER